MRPPARAVVGHLIWSADGGVWALWSVKPFPHAHTAVADKLGVHGSIRSLLVSLPPESMLLSVCERLDPLDVVRRMADGVDLDRYPAWASVCDASADWLEDVPLRRRLFYVAAALPNARRPWLDVLRDAQADVGRSFGLAPRPVPTTELDLRRRQARELELRLAQHVEMRPVTAGEVCWLYARSLRRALDEPCFDQGWEPPPADPVGGRRGNQADAERWRPRGVLAHLTDAVVKEGGDADDEDRPRHRRYVRIDGPSGSSYQTVLALADMPHYFRFPGGGGEWLYYADHAGFPVDWCVRTRSIKNADAQTKVRRKHRDLVGQVDEYDGELTGAPPQLAEAIQAIDEERSELGANPAEPELQATILLSLAAPTLAELEDQAGTLTAMFQPHEYGLARPTGGQAALLRSMLPGTAAAAVCRDYTQFMLARDLAAGSPFCGSDVGDPGGLLLGLSLDGGNGTPVLFDPAFGPKANASPSLAAVGRLGSGKSFFLKRLCWDTVARGGQVVTIDRTQSGEYVRFAEALPGRVQVVRIEAGADVRLDPMRSFSGDERTTVTLGFLSLLAGCSAHTEEGAALADAVDAVASRPGGSLSDIIDELERMGADARHPDPAARGLARRLSHYRRSATGALAFGEGDPMSLDADFIVFWAPHLALPDRETLTSEHGARMMLPEQVLGQALLYLVAAVGRRVVFRDPRRFAAALYDEAWALLASPHGQNLLIEGVRDGRKHNGAIWLASQHPNDFAISELEDLLGSRFVFRQARRAIPASLRFLGVTDSVDAGVTLEQGLATGVCLYRDVRDRVGLIQVLPPTLPEIDTVFDTSPSGGADAGRPDAAELALDDPDGFDAEDDEVGELAEYTGRLSTPPELAAGGVAGSPGAGEAPRGEGADAPAGVPAAASADDEVRRGAGGPGTAAPADPDARSAPGGPGRAPRPGGAGPGPATPAAPGRGDRARTRAGRAGRPQLVRRRGGGRGPPPGPPAPPHPAGPGPGRRGGAVTTARRRPRWRRWLVGALAAGACLLVGPAPADAAPAAPAAPAEVDPGPQPAPSCVLKPATASADPYWLCPQGTTVTISCRNERSFWFDSDEERTVDANTPHWWRKEIDEDRNGCDLAAHPPMKSCRQIRAEEAAKGPDDPKWDPPGLLPDGCWGSYPVTNYQLTWKPGSWYDVTEYNQRLMGWLTQMMFGAGVSAIQLVQFLVDWGFSFDVAQYSQTVADLADRYDVSLVQGWGLVDMTWFILIAFAGFMALKGKLAVGGGEILVAVVLAGLATVLMQHKEMYMRELAQNMDLASSDLMLAAVPADERPAIPANATSKQRIHLSLQPIQARINEEFIETPYAFLNWGKRLTAKCLEVQEGIIAVGDWGDDGWPTRYMERQGDECKEAAEYNGSAGIGRMFGALMTMIIAFVIVAFLGLAAFTVALAKFLLAVLFAVTPFVVIFAVLPGAGRRLCWAWVGAVVQIVLMAVGMSFMLALMMVSVEQIMDNIPDDTDLIERWTIILLLVSTIYFARKKFLTSGQAVATSLADNLTRMSPSAAGYQSNGPVGFDFDRPDRVATRAAKGVSYGAGWGAVAVGTASLRLPRNPGGRAAHRQALVQQPRTDGAQPGAPHPRATARHLHVRGARPGQARSRQSADARPVRGRQGPPTGSPRVGRRRPRRRPAAPGRRPEGPGVAGTRRARLAATGPSPVVPADRPHRRHDPPGRPAGRAPGLGRPADAQDGAPPRPDADPPGRAQGAQVTQARLDLTEAAHGRPGGGGRRQGRRQAGGGRGQEGRRGREEGSPEGRPGPRQGPQERRPRARQGHPGRRPRGVRRDPVRGRGRPRPGWCRPRRCSPGETRARGRPRAARARRTRARWTAGPPRWAGPANRWPGLARSGVGRRRRHRRRRRRRPGGPGVGRRRGPGRRRRGEARQVAPVAPPAPPPPAPGPAPAEAAGGSGRRRPSASPCRSCCAGSCSSRCRSACSAATTTRPAGTARARPPATSWASPTPTCSTRPRSRASTPASSPPWPGSRPTGSPRASSTAPSPRPPAGSASCRSRPASPGTWRPTRATRPTPSPSGADLLVKLFEQHGSWPAAITAYHMLPDADGNIPDEDPTAPGGYLEKVKATWDQYKATSALDAGLVSGIPYADIFNSTAALGIDPRLVAAVAWQESIHFDPDVIACRRDSPKGAKGIMQFMPATAAERGVDPCKPESAIPGGARYLLELFEKFGTWELALAAYNAGPGNVEAAGRRIPDIEETQKYVPAVMAKWEEYKRQFPSGTVEGSDGQWALPGPRALLDRNPRALNNPHHDYPAWDWGIPTGTPIYAVRSGTVAAVYSNPHNCYQQSPCGSCGIGATITDADGNRWTYCHGSQQLTAQGAKVQAGTQILVSGNTGNSSGPHLHLEIRVNGRQMCPQSLLTAIYNRSSVPTPGTCPPAGASAEPGGAEAGPSRPAGSRSTTS